MAAPQEEKSFFSSFTSLFKPKPVEAQPNKPANEKKPTTTTTTTSTTPAPSNATTPRANAGHTQAEHADHDHADHSERSERSERSELSEYSDVEHAEHAERAEQSDTETDTTHHLVEQAGELGTEDQQKSEELDKAIEAAEARTAAKLEQIKSEKKETKEGEEPERKTWLVQTSESIKYTFISKETEEAFGEIMLLFDKMFDDFPYNKVDLMFGLMMLDDYYKNAPVLSSERVEDMEFIETARFYMKFAYCCYGWKFIYGILNRKPNRFITSMVGFDANIKAIFDCTGVEPKDIIVSKFTSSVFDPGHYICLCHERKTIVVAFRGTFHVRDALTDLVASNTAFMHGTAHTGLLRTANNKFKLLAPSILKLYQENPTYKVIVVGHSLGAGTASLFSLIFHEAHPEVPMHCYAYAPPGVVSPDVALASTTTALIDSIVVGNDVVPRLSFATLNHLKKIIMQILSSGNNTFQRAFQWMAGGLNDGLKDKVNGMFKIPETAKVEATPVPISDVSVFPPGRLILLVPHTLTEIGVDEEGCSSDSETDEKAKEEKAVKEKEEIEKEKEREEGTEMMDVDEKPIASEKEGKAVVEGKAEAEGKIIRKAILDDKVILEVEKVEKEKPVESEKEINKEQEKETKKEQEKEKEKQTEKIPPSSPAPSISITPSTPIPSSASSSSAVSSSPSPSSALPSSTPPAAPPSSNPLRRLSASVAPLFWTSPKTPQAEKAKKAKKPPKPKNVYLMEYSNSALFNEIIISPNMFTSHMPSAYDRALDSCLETMRQLKSGSSKHNIVVTME